ncbi:SGNH/GDSL hydrolase family protein [Paraburkholderia bryophila]|nr:SGNH/GDSL hydrolase family protein [Paraburkholderia bryophila]
MYGDSTMAGYTYPNGPCGAAGTGACDPSTAVITPDNAPYNMAASLAAQLIPVTVSNQGVSGAELSDLIAGRHGYAQSWAQTLPSLNARIAVANYAINDLGRGDETPELYGQYLAAWVDSVRAAGMIPVLEEPNPVCRPGYENLPAYVGQMDSVAAQKNVPLIDQYSYLLSLPNWQGMLSDCMHPKPEMYEIKGKREAQIIGPIAASLGS